MPQSKWKPYTQEKKKTKQTVRRKMYAQKPIIVIKFNFVQFFI